MRDMGTMMTRRRWAVLMALLMVHCSLFVSHVVAQSYTLTGEVEPVVHVGENFKLCYVLNTTDASNFRLGTIPDALDVLIGPNQSTSISTVIVNGSAKTTQTLTLTYVLSASKTGKFTIPAASVKTHGETIHSQPLTVQVIAANSPQSGGAGGRASAAQGGEFFISVVPSKRRVTEYEPFLLTYKVCWHPDVPVINLDAINLELQNVYMQPYNDTQQKSKKVETINGRVLVTVDWQQYVIYPQKAGRLQIPAQKMKGYVREDVAYDPFDPFTSGYREVARMLTAPAVDIQVDELADKPADFSGGVGRFSISAEMDKQQVKENTPVTITVKVEGRGNLNMLKQPVIAFPRGFDTYDTKQTDDFKLTAEGLNGSVGYEFVAVPQRKGVFTIPPARLTYYDSGSHSYRTVQTDSFRLEVLKGEGTASAVHDFSSVEATTKGDIHPIKMGVDKSARQGVAFFASTAYFAVMALLVLAFIVLFVVLRIRSNQQADVVKSKGRRANKVAVRRLRKAAKLMREGKPGEFYDETLRALWGYVGDKLNIPVSQLSRQNISQQLLERGVGEQVTNQFIEAIDECEFVRYAPGDPQGNMNKVYELSITAIEQIENVKNKVKSAGKAHLLLMVVLMLSSLSSAAQSVTKVQADEAYNNEEYEEAIEMYGKLLASGGGSAHLYYNLGNAYFRLDSMACAILCYERALRLQPSDDDIRFNLQLACSKTEDKIVPEREMFFVTWYRSLVTLVSVDAWAYVALGALAVAVVLLLVYFFSYAERLRRFAFFGSLILLVVFLLGNLFAFQQKRMLHSHDAAIVMQPVVAVKNIPSDDGTDEFTLHAGTKVNITDDTMTDWKQIHLPDGREGWVKTAVIENI